MVPTANDMVAARIADWLQRLSCVLMPAWVGRQNPAARASKIYGQIEVIDFVPFRIEDLRRINLKQPITKARKHEKE